MYAPWRHKYVTKEEKLSDKKKKLKNNCVFCDQLEQNDDAKYLILKRFRYCVVMMNYYPYNSGHVMVLPYEHKGILHDFTSTVRAALMEATTSSIDIIEETMECEGFNVGINQGIAGGGGIRDHLHIHILPRWQGDTNFLATLGDVTLVCSDFRQVYELLKKNWISHRFELCIIIR